MKKVKHAGAVFLGPYTPEAIGDYLAGPNHILRRQDSAVFISPRRGGFCEGDERHGLYPKRLGRFEKDVRRFAEWEGLEGHYQAVRVRMKR